MNSAIALVLVLATSLACRASPPGPEMERRITALEKESAELRGRVEILTSALIELTGDTFGPPTFSGPVAIDALVLEVKREPAIVVLDKGASDEVEVGSVFDVYRGATYKGQVRILDVQQATCSGVILSEHSTIERGDSASTNL